MLDGQFDDLITYACICIERKNAAIGLAIPAIENVFGAAAQSPDREVESKRRDGMQRERQRSVGECAFGAKRRGVCAEIS